MAKKYVLSAFEVPLCPLAVSNLMRRISWALVLTLGLVSLAQGQEPSHSP